MNRQVGFTLIELMIAVVVVSILAMVALPSYNEYVLRGKIPDATSNLATKRVQQEQYFQDNRQYVDGQGGCAADTTTSQYFNFACTGVTTTAYTLTATGKGSMTGFTFTVNQSNAKATTAVPTGWTANGTCWVTSTGGTC